MVYLARTVSSTVRLCYLLGRYTSQLAGMLRVAANTFCRYTSRCRARLRPSGTRYSVASQCTHTPVHRLASPHPVSFSCMPATVSGSFRLHPAPHPLPTHRYTTQHAARQQHGRNTRAVRHGTVHTVRDGVSPPARPDPEPTHVA